MAGQQVFRQKTHLALAVSVLLLFLSKRKGNTSGSMSWSFSGILDNCLSCDGDENNDINIKNLFNTVSFFKNNFYIIIYLFFWWGGGGGVCSALMILPLEKLVSIG